MSVAAPTLEIHPVWTPSELRRREAQMTRFMQWLRDAKGLDFSGYEELWRWSIEEMPAFWSAVWDYFEVAGERGSAPAVTRETMPGAQWFSDARVNFVQQVFRGRDADSDALIFHSESLGSGSISWLQLERDVAAFAATLRDLGVQPGDRVVALLPNVPHAIVAFLGVASVGAVWSICSPEAGERSVTERFQQIDPVVIVACNGYRYGGKDFDRREAVSEIVAALPTLKAFVHVPLLEHLPIATLPVASCVTLTWGDALAGSHRLDIAQLPFDHPLWILYSSGTTGLPKAIVHGHGGILLNGLVSTSLHGDVVVGQRVLRLCNTAWMVWNMQVMALLVGGTLCLFEGSPTGPARVADWGHMWGVVARLKVHCFGAGAAFYLSCLKAGVDPARQYDLRALKTVISTGSPLALECYRWIYQSVDRDVWLYCVSGGTDICSAFLTGTPMLPVYRGELQCRALGAAVYVFDDDGRAVYGQVGELVCTRPLPSMPLYFWNDRGDKLYLQSYFEAFTKSQGGRIWRHGDWLGLTERPEAVGGIIYGRSDATINRQGVRMGSAEFYRVVEAFTEVADSLIIDLEYRNRDPRLILFVVLCHGVSLTEGLADRVRQAIRAELSPRHVPDDIIEIAAVPRNRSGKKLEVPVRRLLLGHPPEQVLDRDVTANPESLDWFVSFARAGVAGLLVPTQ